MRTPFRRSAFPPDTGHTGHTRQPDTGSTGHTEPPDRRTYRTPNLPDTEPPDLPDRPDSQAHGPTRRAGDAAGAARDPWRFRCASHAVSRTDLHACQRRT